MQLAGRVVLLTGSSRGIGGACAAALVERGAYVIVHGRDPDRLDDAVADLGVKTLQADLSRPGAAEELAEAAREVHGHVDVVVHSAGVGWYGPATAMPTAKLDELWHVNVRAPIVLSSMLVPDMVARGAGHVAFVGSVAGLTGVANEAAYAATKAGLMTYAESLRFELLGTGVGVSVVSPAVVRTDFFARRGTPYGRRYPRPISASRVAERVIAGIEQERAHQVVPRWLVIAPIVRSTLPAVFRGLSGRFG